MKPEEKKTPEAPADVDRLVAYRSLAALDRGDSYRVFLGVSKEKNKLSVAQAGGLS
jgi:hypothetical protein